MNRTTIRQLEQDLQAAGLVCRTPFGDGGTRGMNFRTDYHNTADLILEAYRTISKREPQSYWFNRDYVLIRGI